MIPKTIIKRTILLIGGVFALSLVTTSAVWAACSDPAPKMGAAAPVRGVDWSGCDLSGVNLYDVFLYRANLEGANLTGANLESANLYEANLTDADLTGANLTSANVSSANLTGTNLTGANLTKTHLMYSNLTGANLTDADLTDTALFNTVLTSATWTDGRKCSQDSVYTCNNDQQAPAPTSETVIASPGRPQETVEPQKPRIVLASDIVRTGQPVAITVSELPGNPQDWVTLIEASRPDSEFGVWEYTKGVQQGTWQFTAGNVGDYEVRVYFDWPKGKYVVKARASITITE